MPLFQTLRFFPKDFRQRRPDGKGEWIWNLQGVRRVLYRLPELLAAKNADPKRMIFVVEGEKDADALQRGGATATCNPMGAGKWRDEYAEFLRGYSRSSRASRWRWRDLARTGYATCGG
jgi:putative DNA primase/helicase